MELLQLELKDTAMHQIIGLVHDYTGITISTAKRDMLQIRLRPRLRHLGLKSYEAYIDYLRANMAEKEFFINRVTTNETQFFRTPRIWDYIQKQFLPEWQKKHPQKTLNIWSAAASTGEEGYSLAMSCEDFRRLHPFFQYTIFGTDISTDALATARLGKYSGRSMEGLRERHPAHYDQYCMKDEDSIRVMPKLQQNVTFSQHSLQNQLMRQGQFPLVLLRNVMIYFTAADQEHVLRMAAKSMEPGGILIIGESESLTRLNTPFEYVEPLIYRLPA